MDKYTKLEKLGEGAHGVVTKARVRTVEEIRAIRKASAEQQMAEEGVSSSLAAAVAATGNTPKKRKHEGDTDATAATDESKMEDTDDLEIIEPVELPAPADTIVAIKKIRLRSASEGLSMEAMREIKLLQELDHPNVLKMMDIFSHHSNINLVLEYMTGDLEGLIRSMNRESRPLPPADIKAYMKMILQGIEHCHQRWIMHRDIKPGNILIGQDGSAKLADFGLAKIYGSPERRMSPGACTIWYRAPELLFGASSYGAAADMWSVGCIMGELFWMKPMFAAVPESELQQLKCIFALLGTPTTPAKSVPIASQSNTDWPDVAMLKHYIHFKPQAGHAIRELFGAISEDAADLLSGLLTLNPLKRLTATEALQHRYFRERPLPTPLAQLPKINREKPPPKVTDRAGKASGKTLNFDSP